ncbi:MAG TPA: MBL fold metallo-hydrolase [Calidithermus sp.]|nr:MBL fold metallo-hydrolase [Calidithermus sp.]
MATIEFLGAVGTVTGSKHLLTVGARRLLIDCGLYQGLKELRLRNWAAPPVDPAAVDWLALTHAHIDHTGYLPRFRRLGFRGPIYATRATVDLLKILLPDSGHLQEEEAAYHNRHGTSRHHPALPLYTAEEGERAAAAATGVRYDEPVVLDPSLAVTFRRAGHILGSAAVAVDFAEDGRRRRVVFSGDVGRYGAPLMPDPAPAGEADYVVVESTYGDRRHDAASVPERLERLIRAAVARGGPIVVPAFAVGRTQDLMYHLGRLERAGRIPRLPIYLDSPMAIRATELYRAHLEELDGEARAMVARGASPFEAGEFHLARTVEESRAINDVSGPAIIVSASGMATGGRVLHHLRRRLPDPRTTVLLVGYQALGTRGRRLEDGERSVRIFGEDVPVRATVEVLHGLSAHADADGLLRWLGTARRPPRRTFVVHGDPGPAAALAARIRKALGWEVVVPAYRDRVPLE